MSAIASVLLAVLSIWDYPARWPIHVRLRDQFVAAVRSGDTETMEETCRKGIKLLPEDPTWHFNLACSLAYFPKRTDEAFEELEKAIDYGFRDARAIEEDGDLKRLAEFPRYREAIEYAKFKSTQPLMLGPMATVTATGVFGKSISLGEQNLSWDFDHGCFQARLDLLPAKGASAGDLYFNRDGAHSLLRMSEFPGLTAVSFDQDGRSRNMDKDFPNTLFPYPVFGNCSRALVGNPQWRSLSRALLTMESRRMPLMLKFYLSNQFWVFPSNADTAPVGTNGDVFASIAPYWLTTAGRSYSDLPYLRAAVKASSVMPSAVKKKLVAQGLLAPTLMTLMRKSLKTVKGEDGYLTPSAHPTAMPPNGLDDARFIAAASALKEAEVPPLAIVSVKPEPVAYKGSFPELTYATAFAWAWVMRASERQRSFVVSAKGAEKFAFVQTHGNGVAAKIERLSENSARVTFDSSGLSPTNRLDVTVVGRNAGTGWGAPSYISFSRMDSAAPYSDPILTVLPDPKAPARPSKLKKNK